MTRDELLAALDAERYAQPFAWAHRSSMTDDPEVIAARRAAVLAELATRMWAWARRPTAHTAETGHTMHPRTPPQGPETREHARDEHTRRARRERP